MSRGHTPQEKNGFNYPVFLHCKDLRLNPLPGRIILRGLEWRYRGVIAAMADAALVDLLHKRGQGIMTQAVNASCC